MYEIGKTPTQEEFRTYWRVDRFYLRGAVAQFIEDRFEDGARFDGERRPTEEEFERICDEFGEMRENSGEEEWNDIWWAYHEVMG